MHPLHTTVENCGISFIVRHQLPAMDAQDTTSFVSCIHIALRDSMNHLMYFIFSFSLIFINSLFSFFFFFILILISLLQILLSLGNYYNTYFWYRVHQRSSSVIQNLSHDATIENTMSKRSTLHCKMQWQLQKLFLGQ